MLSNLLKHVVTHYIIFYRMRSVNAYPSTQFSTKLAPCRCVTNCPSRRRFSIQRCLAVFFSKVLYMYEWENDSKDDKQKFLKIAIANLAIISVPSQLIEVYSSEHNVEGYLEVCSKFSHLR